MERKNSMKSLTALLVVSGLLLAVLSACAGAQPATTVPGSSATTTSQQTTTTLPTTTQPTQPTTQPTQPTQPTTQPTQPTQAPEPENPVPEHLRNNYYLVRKGQGACDQMTGNIKVVVIFVSDSVSKWDKESIENAKPVFADHETRMEADAARYGAEMDITMEFLEANISVEFTFDTGKMTPAYLALNKVGLGDGFYDQNVLETYYNVDSVPVLFVLNRAGRAFATTMDQDNDMLECAIIYGDDLSSVRHEIYHIFGAEDLYFPADTVAAMNKYLPTSIMYNHYNDADDLTAFLIGWVDKLSQNARLFLEETNHLTREEIEEAQKVS